MKQQGFNHNIRHQGILFHVQTEDYGKDLHKVVTQLFFGGQIVNKVETDYQHVMNAEDVDDQIKEIMKTQHKKMLKDLTDGNIEIPQNIVDQSEATS